MECCISAHLTQLTRASARCNNFCHARSRQSRSLPFTILFPTPLLKAKVRIISSTSANKSCTSSWPTPVFHSQRRLLFSSFFGHFLVSVHLPLFAYMSLNYVAILYKNLHVSTLKYHPVLFYPICVLPQLFKLSAPLLACSLSSTFAPSLSRA